MRGSTFFILVIIGLIACIGKKPESPPRYLKDLDSRSYNDGLIAINNDFVFLNSKNSIVRLDHNGNNQTLLLTYSQGQTVYNLHVRDSILILQNKPPGLYIIGYNGLYSNSISFPNTHLLRISEAKIYQKRMIVLDIGRESPEDFDNEKSGTMELFDFNSNSKFMKLVNNYYKGLLANGFFIYQDSLIYTYDYTRSYGSIKFARFNINDSIPNIETNGLNIRKSNHLKMCVIYGSNDLYISNGKDIYICEMNLKFFVVKKIL